MVQKQIIFDKYRTLLPIIHDIALVKKLAQEPAIIAIALHEEDPKIHSEGLNTLERNEYYADTFRCYAWKAFYATCL